MTKYRVTVLLKSGKKIRSKAEFTDEDMSLLKDAANLASGMSTIRFSMGKNRGRVFINTNEIAAIFIV